MMRKQIPAVLRSWASRGAGCEYPLCQIGKPLLLAHEMMVFYYTVMYTKENTLAKANDSVIQLKYENASEKVVEKR